MYPQCNASSDTFAFPNCLSKIMQAVEHPNQTQQNHIERDKDFANVENTSIIDYNAIFLPSLLGI